MPRIISNDVYEIVTAIIIEQLENGTVPWKQPWRDAGAPRNYVTKRPYRGINLLLLGCNDYESNEYLTFRQITQLGGVVKKGEKAHLVVLWLWVDDDDARKGEPVKVRKKPLLRYYYVFNLMQCTGIYVPKDDAEKKPDNPSPRCERIINGMPQRPKIVHNENEAYYHPVADFINMPRMEMFERREGYYAILFHELVHSTGYETRLNRKELAEQQSFGDENYSIEELTAEIGACYLATHTGIALNGLANSAAYINGWLSKLRKDKKFIVYAASHAQKAVDFILGNHLQNDDRALVKNERL